HANDPEAQVGVAMNLIVFDPKSRANLLDWISARTVASVYNWAFYDSILAGRIQLSVPGLARLDEPLPDLVGSADFLGVNYYTRYLIRFAPGQEGFYLREPGPGPKSDLSWEI